MIRFRAFEETPEEFEILARIANEYNDRTPSTGALWMHYRSILPSEAHYQGFFALRDGVEVGVSICMDPVWIAEDNKVAINYSVNAAEIGSDTESALFYHTLEHALEQRPTRIHSFSESRREHRNRLLEGSNFHLKTRLIYSELRLEEFDEAKFSDLFKKLSANGVQIMSVQELIDSGRDWKQPFLDMMNEVMQDIPFHTAFRPMPMKVFEKLMKSPDFDANARYVAMCGERFVGVSMLDRNLVDSRRMATGLTGVVRDFRRTGLATALKARALSWAKRDGAAVVGTENEENNPMLDLNYRLGFEAQFDMLAWVRQVQPVEAN